MTIRQLAQLTGISPATISRVLNNNPKVSEENRRRVLEAVAQTGYRLPKKQDAQPILLSVYGRLTFWEEMYQAISMAAKRLGYTSLTYCVPPEVGKFTLREFEKDGLLFQSKIAGIMFSTVEVDPAEYWQLRRRFPAVFCGNPIRMQGGCAVSTGDLRMSAAVVEKLLDEGHTRIGVLAAASHRFGRDVTVLQGERIAGAEMALHARGLQLACRWEAEGPQSVEAMTDEILASGVDGVFCLHAQYGIALMAALRRRGIDVPGTMGIATYDLDHFPPGELRGMWYVLQNFVQIGEESVRMLDGIIHGASAEGKRLYLDGSVERV